MKDPQDTQRMGSTNQVTSQSTIQRPSSRAPLHKDNQQKISLSSYTQQSNGQSQVSSLIDEHRTQFRLSRKTNTILTRCTSQKGNKFTSEFSYQKLPRAIQATYKSIQQLFEQIKYIIQEDVPNRLSMKQQGRLVFYLQTKKKGKLEYLPQVFQMEQESQAKTLNRLEEDVETLKLQGNTKSHKIDQLQRRLAQIQSMLSASSHNQVNSQSNHQQDYKSLGFSSSTDTVKNCPDDQNYQTKPSQESIIKKFKRGKSNQNLSLKNTYPPANQTQQKPTCNGLTVIKTTINQFDCFFQLQNQGKLKIQLLSRKQAKVYTCIIDQQGIPNSVYSFIPTPSKLYQEISYLIYHNIQNRLDVIENNFIYRASINEKNQEKLVDGVFYTQLLLQNDIERIEELVDLKTTMLQQDVKGLKQEVQLLKTSLMDNDIILQKPQSNYFNSNIVQTNHQYIKLCKFFKSKVFRIQLLYRASQNSFQIRKFHQKCDGIPNTLTLIHTQSGKKIGGFTSQQWDCNGNGKSVSDYQNHSFIFSLTNRHQFSLQQHEHAIQTSPDDGPRFGNGADLVIKDKANQNTNSYANICTSYTHPRYTYKNAQSYKYFSGDQKSNRFTAKQWEVFEVFFED